MATNFPTSLDSLVNPIASDSMATVNHASQHTDANDAIEALQAKVGVNSSAVTTSLDYLVRNIDADSAIVSGSSASDLVRITQTGAGNALLVEDNTNPDSTPFAVDSSGRLLVGHTASVTLGLVTPQLQVSGTVASNSALSSARYSADTSSPRLILAKSRNATVGSHTALVAADEVGRIDFYGSDGTTFKNTSSIISFVEDTVSTDIVPSHLRFYTTDSAGVYAERVRITPFGAVGIGQSPGTGRSFLIGGNLNAAVSGNYIGAAHLGTLQSNVTGVAYGFNTNIGTAASAFTVSSINHFRVDQGTFGAGSTVTNQYGFFVESTMVGATNNAGFYGNIPSGTGRWNLYMAGTANNYLAGRLGVGAFLTSGSMAQIVNTTASDSVLTVKGAASQSGVLLDLENSAGTTLAFVNSLGRIVSGHTAELPSGLLYRFQSVSTDSAAGYSAARYSADAGAPVIALGKSRSAVASAFSIVSSGDNVGTLDFRADDGAAFISAAQIVAQVDGTPGSNDMPGRLIFSTTADGASAVTERMRIDSAGRVGIGAATNSTVALYLMKTVTGGTNAYGVYVGSAIQSDVTGSANVFSSVPATQAASFTLGTLSHFKAIQGTIGAGSTVTNQIGFSVDSTLTGASNNYGFYGNIASGSGRWNLYMAGTADNYLAGNLLVGMTTVATSSAKTIHIGNGTAPTANPTSGGVLYVESGALKYRGSSGTVTTIANA